MRRLCLVMIVLVVGLFVLTAFVSPTHAQVSDFIISDCAAFDGVWDGTTRTCTLTRDVPGSIRIFGDNLTLDGAGFTVRNSQPIRVGVGIFLDGGIGNIVRNIHVEGFSDGIWAFRSYSATLANITAEGNGTGIRVQEGSGIMMG